MKKFTHFRGHDIQEINNAICRAKKNVIDVIEKVKDSENWDQANTVPIHQDFEVITHIPFFYAKMFVF